MKTVFLILLLASFSRAASMNVGRNEIDPAAGQVISLFVSGGDPVTGFNLRAVIGDGTGPGLEPVFQSVGYDAAFWGSDVSVIGGVVVGAPSDAQGSIVLNQTGISVPAVGHMLDLIVSAAGIDPGTYPLRLSGTEIGADSEFISSGGQPIPVSILNGSIVVVPDASFRWLLPAAIALWVLTRRPRRV